MSERATRNLATTPAGEDQGNNVSFTAAQLAAAFGVAPDSVANAAAAELGHTGEAPFDSKDAQRLAEIFLADRPLADQQATLMELGAFTPRSDATWGLGDTAPGEESDRLAARADTPDDDLSSKLSSHDPATQDAR